MISKNRVEYFVWTTHSHEGSIFLKVVKNILLKSEGCHLVVQDIPLWGVICHFKVSNNEVTAKHSKPPSVSFKIQTYGEPRVDMNHSKVRVRLHLWFHSLNFAWTLHWQQLTLSWKGFKRSKVGSGGWAKQWYQIEHLASYKELCNIILRFAP